MDKPAEDMVLLCGRYFTLQELLEIQATVRMFPNLTRKELVNTLCENLDWVTPTGKYKQASCADLLDKLESKGLITLPEKRKCNPFEKKEINFGPLTAPAAALEDSLINHEPVTVEPVDGSGPEVQLWNEYVHRYHSLGYKTPFGAHQRYFIFSGSGQRLGCLLYAAAAFSLASRDAWIGWTKTDRSLRVNLIVNNTRFLIFPWVHIKNLASRSLSLAAKRIRQDWQRRYGYSPVLLETFVDTEQYRGTCYQAANWTYLGHTAGRGRTEMHNKKRYSCKAIYVHPLVADFRAHLKGAKSGE